MARLLGCVCAVLGVMCVSPQEAYGQVNPVDPPEWTDCASAEGWVGEASRRWVENSGLVRFAREELGLWTGCVGRVEDHFDGAAYGTVRLMFEGEESLSLTTMPISTSITSWESARGFERVDAVRAAVRDHTEAIGVEIDWETPERDEDAAGVLERFWDPDPGMNASVSFRYVSGRLVSVTFSMAL